MTFEIHSDITNRSMTVAARAMRRVLRRKRSIMWAIFGWSVFLFNALLLIPFDGEPFALDVRTVTSLLVEVMLLSVLLFQNRFNGMIARKNALAGTKEYHVAFGEDSYSFFTNTTRIIIRTDAPLDETVTVRLWNTENMSENILLARLDKKQKICTFTHLSSRNRYAITVDNMPDISISVSSCLTFWEALSRALQNE